ncbi:hypothetical protein CCO02nite_17610 [Cellulomonas composti]|uniref:Uncharacterized protein n=1 Tax=Cellulomonas composti TaxID=266130 RepID=A0A511JBM3_9CELL|nr:hypothetical protein CCO02nite_17610 [Cellulomonas composti]
MGHDVIELHLLIWRLRLEAGSEAMANRMLRAAMGAALVAACAGCGTSTSAGGAATPDHAVTSTPSASVEVVCWWTSIFEGAPGAGYPTVEAALDHRAERVREYARTQSTTAPPGTFNAPPSAVAEAAALEAALAALRSGKAGLVSYPTDNYVTIRAVGPDTDLGTVSLSKSADGWLIDSMEYRTGTAPTQSECP